MNAPLKIELMSRLGTFRPSDRTHIENALKSVQSRQVAVEAITEFVIGWENADWLEAYSIERIGKWLAKNQSADVVEILNEWSQKPPVNARQEARAALCRGIEIGKQQKANEFA
ncbi:MULTISPECIES: hypothetical protein [Agrobacterium]|uniref:Uncharacterized protein n=1 Tax=Agrobacterium tumefaciens TaxID=358 RepID=A0AAE6BAH1_AGRTU|nr:MULTISPECIES: hypothetical protein [Agrobacterium]QCL73637.1 hypothetical protein CFBP5499_09575 [Agrobacterium tumefaciens]QCL79210.1 hypothetical protein CFBP5877_09105 [Agrobacterium tumefaciens]CUX39426.1 hypothetical protein AGR6A_Cc60124 [Agrobacterium sp. NCPPB 925]